jgi:hypothetical protein
MPSQPTRWRLIPTILIGFIGGSLLLGGLTGSAFHLLSRISGFEPASRFFSLPSAMGQMVAGLLWVAGARFCWQRRWMWATCATLVGYVLAVVTFSNGGH